MRSLVTGGAGFIGSHLVDALVARGDQLLVVDTLVNGREENLRGAFAHGVVLDRTDVRDGGALRQVVEAFAPEVIFHLAAQIDVRVSLADPALDARTNIEGTVNVLEAARLAGSRRVVFASTGGAMYGESDTVPTPESAPSLPMAAYGQSKLGAESYLGLYGRLYGLSTVALRFGNVYGPRQDPHGEAGVIAIFCGALRNGRPITVYGDGRQTRDYIYVGDLVEAIVTAGSSELTGPVNLGTEEETSVLRLVEILAEHAGIDVAPTLAPPRLGELDRSCLDATRARTELGWAARTPVAEGLRLTYDATA